MCCTNGVIIVPESKILRLKIIILSKVYLSFRGLRNSPRNVITHTNILLIKTQHKPGKNDGCKMEDLMKACRLESDTRRPNCSINGPNQPSYFKGYLDSLFYGQFLHSVGHSGMGLVRMYENGH